MVVTAVAFKGRTGEGAAQSVVRIEFRHPLPAAHLQAAMMVMLPRLRASVVYLQTVLVVMPLPLRMPIVRR
jgi:hypothetical protein